MSYCLHDDNPFYVCGCGCRRIALGCFLEEALLHDKIEDDATLALVVSSLVSVYIGLLNVPNLEAVLPNEAVQQPLSGKWLQRHADCMLSFRHAWLDRLMPGNGLSSSAVAVKQVPPKPKPSPQQQHLYVNKLQGLLCNTDLPNVDIHGVLQSLESFEPTVSLSVRLLCLPRIDRFEEAAQLLLDAQPSLALEFGKIFCRQTPKNWSILLHEILLRTTAMATLLQPPSDDTNASSSATSLTLSTGSRHSSDTALLRIYHEVVDHLALTMHATEFLAIMPDNMLLEWLQPYLEKALACTTARLLQQTIVADSKRVLATVQ